MSASHVIPRDPELTNDFSAAIRGSVITREDHRYDEARAVFNGMIDRHPIVIVRCVDASDVIAALRFAETNGLRVSVRGGGHSAPGYSVNDDGLVIDLSLMRHVVVDPVGRRVLVGGGATWGDVDHATAPFGLVVPNGVVSTTGVGGLTLGGGTGHLTRALGLTCDSLLAADVVTADGGLVRASEDTHRELFWALRGGGGNFGVVVNFEFRLHAVSTVLGGPVFYAGGAAKELLEYYREFMRRAPNRLGAFFGFHLAPALPFLEPDVHGQPVCMVAVCWPDDVDAGHDALRPLLEHGAVLGHGIAELPMNELNSASDALAPPGLHNYWRGHYLEDLTDAVIEVHAKLGPRVPTALSAVHLYPVDGAAAEVGAGDTAYSYRDARYSTVVATLWDDPHETEANVQWVRSYWQALQEAAPAGGYVNFLSDDDGFAGVRATYRDNYERLAAIKLAYDPQNVFQMNANIEPAAPIVAER